MNRSIQTENDVARLLDALYAEATERWAARGADAWHGSAAWWDSFYTDRDRDVPFFRDAPEESLVAWHGEGLLPIGPGTRVLELGCGPGRNAIWFAQQGATVDALDLSGTAVSWAQERASSAGVDVRFVCADMFDWSAEETYDVVFDSGCFHHLPPHRRIGYRRLVESWLRDGGSFGLTCFAAAGDGVAAMGSEVDDVELYRSGALAGGLAYGADDLRALFDGFTEIELRRLAPQADGSSLFGESFLWGGLFRS